MKIHLLNNSQQKLGGGFTFLRTFAKYLARAGIEVCDAPIKSDVIFISGATMADRDQVKALKEQGKKIVFRIDNIPRNSRNRNTGTSRLYNFAQMADLVIYQSKWAKDFIEPFVRRDGPVILNGADTDVFRDEGSLMPKDGHPQYLYARFNRDETKNWHVAWYEYVVAQRLHPDAHLWLAGQFSPEHLEYKFDFFQDEKHRYLGVIDEPELMAEIYRATDILLLPYYNDACSQTLVEARNCGVQNIQTGVHGMTGGTPELLSAPIEFLSAEYMTKRYVEEIARL